MATKNLNFFAYMKQNSKRLVNQGPRGYYSMRKPKVENLVTLSLEKDKLHVFCGFF
jgi:hypothetical protein